jgi:hypothetical protein
MDHETQAKQKTMKNVMRGLAALMVPLTASFPVAIFAYWIPSNIFTFFQVSRRVRARRRACVDRWAGQCHEAARCSLHAGPA